MASYFELVLSLSGGGHGKHATDVEGDGDRKGGRKAYPHFIFDVPQPQERKCQKRRCMTIPQY